MALALAKNYTLEYRIFFSDMILSIFQIKEANIYLRIFKYIEYDDYAIT